MTRELLLSVTLVLTTSNLVAQPAEKPDTNKAMTKIGQFMSGNLALMEIQEFKLGKIGGSGKVELYAIKAYHPGLSDTLRGIKFEVTESGQYAATKSALLDMEEVGDLMEALKYLAEVSLDRANNVGKDFVRIVSFTSRDNLTIGYHPSGTSLVPVPDGYCGAGRYASSRMYMTVENYAKMIRMIDQGLDLLGAK